MTTLLRVTWRSSRIGIKHAYSSTASRSLCGREWRRDTRAVRDDDLTCGACEREAGA